MQASREKVWWKREKESAVCLSKKDHKIIEKSKLLIEGSTEALQKAERKSGH